jgi:DNA-binding IclR family transcriptional regulator
VSGSTFRLTQERLEVVVQQLLAATLEVSHRLGWGHREVTPRA